MRLINIRNADTIELVKRSDFSISPDYQYFRNKQEFDSYAICGLEGKFYSEGLYKIYGRSIFFRKDNKSKLYPRKIDGTDVYISSPPKLTICKGEVEVFYTVFAEDSEAKELFDKISNLCLSDGGTVKINEELTLFK